MTEKNNQSNYDFDNITHELSIERSIQINKNRLGHQINKIDRKILNRRKRKLEELLSDNNYFSEDSIKQRDPILYEIYVGSHKKKSEIYDKKMNKIKSGSTVSKFLLDELDYEIHNQSLNEELNKEAKLYGKNRINERNLVGVNSASTNLLEDEEDELIRLMAIRFLMGEDKEYFDYSSVDDNELYDDVEQINADKEEAYFDEEEPSEIMENFNTGIQDY